MVGSKYEAGKLIHNQQNREEHTARGKKVVLWIEDAPKLQEMGLMKNSVLNHFYTPP